LKVLRLLWFLQAAARASQGEIASFYSSSSFLKLLNTPQLETNTGTKMSYGYEYVRKPKHPPASLIERILVVMAVLGLACLCIGFVLFISGNAFGNLMISRIGAYTLVVGMMLVAPRILFWIAAKIVELG